MSKPSGKSRPRRSETDESPSDERARVLKSMADWQAMNETALRLGRGLDRKELIDRVAIDTGASCRRVLELLRVPGP